MLSQGRMRHFCNGRARRWHSEPAIILHYNLVEDPVLTFFSQYSLGLGPSERQRSTDVDKKRFMEGFVLHKASPFIKVFLINVTKNNFYLRNSGLLIQI